MSNSPVSLSASKKWWLFIFSFLYLLPELLFAFTTNYVTFAYRFFTLALSTSLFLLLLALLRNYVKVFVVIGFILTLFLGSVAISTALFYDAKINRSLICSTYEYQPGRIERVYFWLYGFCYHGCFNSTHSFCNDTAFYSCKNRKCICPKKCTYCFSTVLCLFILFCYRKENDTGSLCKKPIFIRRFIRFTFSKHFLFIYVKTIA